MNNELENLDSKMQMKNVNDLKQNPFRADIEPYEYANFVPRESMANVIEGHFIHVIGAAYSDECSEMFIGITGKGGTASEARERAYKAWNTRHYPPEVQQAVERMKPKKPKKTGTYKAECHCGKDIIKRVHKFCPDCGQAIDWSGDEQ